ncbi:sialic acid-binding Ig-like lectin 14 isoform X1 [Prionailurus viverrinus]|uniref:sialic acid-binding Ig-like lectin 14 isoform X1 n=1 Tax=Prionailurus viverrinus TaxID=61388 RepID=UPI001FF6DBE6|nr:sialic acid-binding Ig-like lectin 14 isoform X1 [Prionailurus viverrinus]
MVPLLLLPLLLLPLLLGGEDPEYQLRVKESVTVQEGLCVHVPCSFSYPWNPWYSRTMLYIYWFQDRDTSSNRYPVATNNPQRTVRAEARGRFRLVGDPWANNCSLRIRDAMRSDEGVYFFRVERGEDVRYTYTHTTMTLRVAALTQEPDIHFPEPLKSGWPAELTCSLPGSCEGGRPLTFSWVGAALDSLDPETLHSSVLAFTPRPQDHGTKLTCQVKLPEVQATVERTIWLNVSYAPHNLTISIFSNVTAIQHNDLYCDMITTASSVPKTLCNGMSLPVLEGQFLQLVCVADSNPPAVLSWSREGKALSASQPSAPGVLELPHVGAGDEGEFTCQARHPLGSQHISFSLSVQRSPSSCNCVTDEQEGSWPLVLTLLRGALMGAGFLFTYGLTWIYYTRCGGRQEAGLRVQTEPPFLWRRD